MNNIFQDWIVDHFLYNEYKKYSINENNLFLYMMYFWIFF